jgi:putative SOS response-associated peptidase YedK
MDSFATITTTPNSLLKPIHNRMPVILDQPSNARWLDHNFKPEDVLDLLKPFPANNMEAHGVGTG